MRLFFTIATSFIAVPTGIKFFNWLATLWGGRIALNSAMLFACAFIVNFVLGGITGVALAQVPFDIHVHDTYFVVAHFHYIVYGGTVFVIFSSIYHWYPKFTGKLLDERLGIVHFALTFVGFNLCFGPQHWLGINGMPRRVAEYDPQFTLLNQISSVGALLMALSTLPFLYNVIVSYFKGKVAGDNPGERSRANGSPVLRLRSRTGTDRHPTCVIPTATERSPNHDHPSFFRQLRAAGIVQGDRARRARRFPSVWPGVVPSR